MATAAALTAPRHPLLNPWFRKWWIGSTVSIAGDQFYLVALPWVVLQLTGSGLAMGTVLMTAAIPRALLMLLGGAITDRTSPRKVLMATAGTRAAAVALIGRGGTPSPRRGRLPTGGGGEGIARGAGAFP